MVSGRFHTATGSLVLSVGPSLYYYTLSPWSEVQNTQLHSFYYHRDCVEDAVGANWIIPQGRPDWIFLIRQTRCAKLAIQIGVFSNHPLLQATGTWDTSHPSPADQFSASQICHEFNTFYILLRGREVVDGGGWLRWAVFYKRALNAPFGGSAPTHTICAPDLSWY